MKERILNRIIFRRRERERERERMTRARERRERDERRETRDERRERERGRGWFVVARKSGKITASYVLLRTKQCKNNMQERMTFVLNQIEIITEERTSKRRVEVCGRVI